MVAVLSVICCLSVVIIILLVCKIVLIEKDIRAVCDGFAEKLDGDTNTAISVSGSDKSVCKLAAELNARLSVLRKRRLRYELGDSELKNAVANISHDLRTPLTAIEGYLDMLDGENKSENAERYVSVIKNRVDVLKQLSDELFRYSVITSPDYDAPKERVSLNAVLQECILSYYTALKQAGITPEISMPEKNVYLTANRMALTRIFANIVGNAVKYSDGDLCISLNENGEVSFGNSASKLSTVQTERLFDRFYTVESARKSTGLGLTIAKALAEQAGGKINAEYKEGRLTINLRFPPCERISS